MKPTDTPKFEAPSPEGTPAPASSQEQPVPVPRGSILLFQATNAKGKKELLAGKLEGREEGGNILIKTGHDVFNCPVSAVVKVIDPSNDVPAEYSRPAARLDDMQSQFNRITALIEKHRKSTPEEYGEEIHAAELAQAKLALLKNLLYIINPM